MRRAAAALAAALLLAGPAVAQEDATPRPAVDVKTARLVFTEAVFGWCAKQVTGSGFVPTTLDPSGPGWAPLEPIKGRKGAQDPSRVHGATGVIVELKPDKSSCFVQIEARGSDILAVALRELLVRAPLNGILARDTRTAEGHGVTYAVRHGRDGPVCAISINEYRSQPRLLTAVVARDPDTGPAPKPAP